MADDVSQILEKMKLTLDEEETINISDEGQQEELESCALSLIGKFLTCKPFNKRAALTTLKKAWGLEDGVQAVEVGSNLFQFKFRSEFELNRVYIRGLWSFDNRALLLTRWKLGMTAMNVKFDTIALWIQIWGAPFEMRFAWVPEEVGNRLGRVLGVERRRNNDSQNFFMWVKVALPLEKEIRWGAFLASSEGKKYWTERGVLLEVGDWADRENFAENQGSGGVEKGGGDFDSLLGGQKPCLHESSEVAPKSLTEHVQVSNVVVGLNNTRKLSTWTGLVRMEVGPVGIIKEGAKSILGKRNNLIMEFDGEVENNMVRSSFPRVVLFV
ncbi:hypothetical protein CFP56_007571 [Quercus suber]|uniref:DUF4283 domain-containing protein n=1 Tax=Quercus suber TaxID=58331 RepID=A0AAW0L5H4_QUESU